MENWYAQAFNATLEFTKTLQSGQLNDTLLLADAAQEQASAGNGKEKFHFSQPINGNPAGSYTLSELNGFVLSAAKDKGKSGPSKVQAAQAAFGLAQQKLSQYNTQAGAFTEAEKNKATTSDSANITQELQIAGALNQTLNQLASLSIQG